MIPNYFPSRASLSRYIKSRSRGKGEEEARVGVKKTRKQYELRRHFYRYPKILPGDVCVRLGRSDLHAPQHLIAFGDGLEERAAPSVSSNLKILLLLYSTSYPLLMVYLSLWLLLSLSTRRRKERKLKVPRPRWTGKFY
jgi:hypothetical protein